MNVASKITLFGAKVANKSKPIANASKNIFYRRKFMKALDENKDFTLVYYSGSKVALKYKDGTVLSLAPIYGYMLLTQWPMWKREYLGSSDVSGKNVLDIGAGCGETALFYLVHGAKKVICVEIEDELVKLMEHNKKTNPKLNIEIVSKPFDISMIKKYKPDFIKVDCEGCEKALLDLDSIDVPIVIETHSNEVKDGLLNKFRNLKPLIEFNKEAELSIIGSISQAVRK
jgi:hypothetical protein